MLIPTYVGGALVFGAGLDRQWQLIMLGRLPIAAARSLYPGDRTPSRRSPAGGGGRPAAS